MSSDTLMRILCETSDRMHAAKDAAELRRIGIDHVRALGADLAATAFLQIASNSVFSREQQALFLMHTLGEMIESAWAQIADSTGTAVELVHHSRKTGGQEVTAEDARGAASLVYKARAARVLNAMTKDEADRAGVEMRGTYFRVDRGKGNLAPPSSDASTWFHLASVDLGNGGPGNLNFGDSVGVVEAWQWPDAFAGIEVRDLTAAQVEVMAGGPWRQSPQSPQWIGYPIAKALRLDPESKADRQRIGRLLKTWIANGMFVTVEGQDEARRTRSFVEVGTLACSTSDDT